MNANIAESKGIFGFGRLAYGGMLCSIAICYGKAAIIGFFILFGASESIDLNPHLQAVFMVLFAGLGLWGLASDYRYHHDRRPSVLALAALIILLFALYVEFHKSIEFSAYFTLIIAVFWNQNLGLKTLTEQLRKRQQEIEQKNLQLEQASRMKSKFLAAMSHELRTPLNAIIGFSEVLEARMFGELNEKQAEYIDDIHVSGRHLLALINDILDLSKIEAGRMELDNDHFDLPQTLESAMLLVQERCNRHGLTLALDVDERLGEIVGDERKIKQILLNLLSNAVKFTPDGGKVDIKAAPGSTGVEIAVSDTGIGIARDEQEAIFEEFHQVSTQDSQQEGTGLGLALSKRFAEMHGGRIDVQSTPGKGSTFTVSLPLQPCPAH